MTANIAITRERGKVRLVMIEWEDSHADGSWQRLDGEIADSERRRLTYGQQVSRHTEDGDIRFGCTLARRSYPKPK